MDKEQKWGKYLILFRTLKRLPPHVLHLFVVGGLSTSITLIAILAGGVVSLVGLPKSDRLKGRVQTKQHRPSAGTQTLSRFTLITFLPGGLYVCTGVRPYDGPTLICAFLWNGYVGVNPQDPS